MASIPLPHQSSLFSLKHKPQRTLSKSNSFISSTSTCFLPPSISLLTTNTLRHKTSPFSSFILRFSTTTQDSVLKEQREGEEEEEFSKTRLIAQNVPWDCTVEDIRSLFEKHGTVVDVELSMHNKTRNRGLAFVSMGSSEEALAALTNLESHEFEGRILRLNYAKPKKKKAFPLEKKPRPVPAFNLFVANLSFEVRSKHLKEFFASEGADVVSAEVIFHDNPRKSSGYGFVSFKTKKEAEAALSSFEGKMFMGRPIRVQRSRQFVKVQPEGGLQSDDTSTESESDSEQVAAE